MITGHNIVLGQQSIPITKKPFDFELKGKVNCLIGPNGAGKSTLLNACLGSRNLCSGEILLSGSPISSMSPAEIARNFAVVPQEHTYPADLRLFDFLKTAFLSKLPLFGHLPKKDLASIEEQSTDLGLTSLLYKRLGRMSTGERQRGFLAHALLQKPSVLLLDEPTNHLDPGGVDKFWECFLNASKNQDMVTLMSTHDLPFIEKNGDWIIALKRGELISQGASKELVRPDSKLYCD